MQRWTVLTLSGQNRNSLGHFRHLHFLHWHFTHTRRSLLNLRFLVRGRQRVRRERRLANQRTPLSPEERHLQEGFKTYSSQCIKVYRLQNIKMNFFTSKIDQELNLNCHLITEPLKALTEYRLRKSDVPIFRAAAIAPTSALYIWCDSPGHFDRLWKYLKNFNSNFSLLFATGSFSVLIAKTWHLRLIYSDLMPLVSFYIYDWTGAILSGYFQVKLQKTTKSQRYLLFW